SDIRDGQVFTAQGVTLQAHHTPGHTTDHMVFTLAEEDAMFTADNVLGQGTAVFEDLGTYIESLTRMKSLFGGRAYPGHGPLIESGSLKINEYIEHRKKREGQVARVLRDIGQEERRPLAAMDIVKVVYRDVSEDLHPAACAGVLQILRKLEAEGKVA
ncbi:MBL fold metallo-hydrolase, partial [Acetobacter estunensis]